MARKTAEPIMERFAVMRFGRYKREVKAWQYYSIFEFCREAGLDREDADRTAKWCRDKAAAGEMFEAGEMTIHVVEKEVA